MTIELNFPEHPAVVDRMSAIECAACGESWAHEPTLRVPCPKCGAAVGQACIWDGPHGLQTHIARDLVAMRLKRMSVCAALTWDGRHARRVIQISDYRCRPPVIGVSGQEPSHA
jgi:predicted RNA-binding Zn-ribbon protein involved in translation (DUF1610 family)